MAKLQTQRKSNSVETARGKGHIVEQTDHFDDTPLPEAAELAKYNEINPKIVEWLMKTVEAEQLHRHNFDKLRINEVKKINGRLFFVDITRIAAAFIIVMSGMAFSYILVVGGYKTVGSIFAGGTIITAVGMFLNIRKNPPKQHH